MGQEREMRKQRILRLAGLAVVSTLALPSPGRAQSTHGAIVGTVSDPSGAVMPGVSITVTNMGTNIGRTAVTNPSGYYEVTALVPGTYRVHGELSGFQPITREGIIVESRSMVRIDLSMGVGAQATEVTVLAATPVIESESAALADTRTARQIEALPMLATGTLFPYVTSLPGVQVVGVAGSTVFSYNGARSGQSEIMFDGMSSARLNTPLAGNPNTMEMTAELKVHSSNNNAEFGSPGVVNLVSKSGTNVLHGTLFYYHSRDQWNEKSRFQATKPVLKRHNFGATFSGPVVLPGYNGHDKTFFTFSYWGEQNPGQNPFAGTVPTAAMRSGDFSAVGGGITVRDPLTGQPFPGNVVPADRISPIAQRLQSRFYAPPNVGDPGVLSARNRQDNVDREAKENRVDLRVDQRFGQKNMLFARFNWKGTVQQPLESMPTVGLRDGWRAHTNFVMSDTHTFSNTVLNELRAGFTRGGNRQLGPFVGEDLIKELGLAGFPDAPYRGMPRFTVSGFSAINSGNNLDDHNNIYQLTDALTWTRNNHTFKGGFDVQHNRANGLDTPNETFGDLTFDGSITGYAYADFLLGYPARSRRATYLGARGKHGTDVAAFVQDSWRLDRKLTVEWGLRYEYQFASVDDDGLMYNFDPATGSVVVPDATVGSSNINPLLPASIKIVSATDAGFPQSLRHAQKANLVPRLGFAWRLSDKTVLRGGYGMFIDSFGTWLTPVQASPLFGYTAEFRNTPTSLQFPLSSPFGAGGALVGALEAGTISVPTFNPDLENSRLHQWSLTVERQIRDVGVRVSYVGTRSANLTYTRNLNLPQPSTTPFTAARRPYPQYANVYYSDNDSRLHTQYHGLQMDVERRFGQSLYVQGAWTYSNLMESVEDVGSEAGPTIENPYDPLRERARAAFNPTHRVNGAIIWDLPIGKNRRFLSGMNGVMEALFGGWQLSGLFYYDTGRYFTPFFTGRDISGTGITSSQSCSNCFSGLRPDLVGNPNLPSGQRTIDRWFDTAAFVIPAANSGRFGTSGRNVIEGPSSKVVHATLAKRFHVSHRTNVQLQVNALNLFNTENLDLNTAALNLSQPATFGKISTLRGGIEAFGPRTINVEARLSF
jgi:hypothetical protein